MSKSNETTPNVPTLRFKQFQDNWSSKRLSDIAEVVGGGTPDTTDSTLWNGGIQWFTPTEVGHSKYVSMSARTISQLGLQKSSAKILPAGSILLSSRATVGECSITQKDCTTNQGFQNLIPKKGINNEFLYYLAQTQKRHFIKYASGSTFLEISNSEIKKTKCAVPSIEEQTEIATFLSAIDRKIEVQNKIISKYETLIKGLSYYIIKKFNGKEYKLGTLAEIYQPQTITKTDLPDNGKYPVYGANGIIGYYNRFNHKESQIMITCRGSTCGTVNLSTPYSWITGNSMVINIDEHKSTVDKKYLYYYLKTQSFNDLISGSGQPQIVRKPLVNLNVFLPEISQQIKLGEIIDIFEKTLKNEKEMLSALQKQKAFLLQSMFI